MTSELTTITIVVGILASGIRLATPYLYAAIGEAFGQRSGVLNLGVEGQMLMGAFAAFYVALTTGNLWLGLLAAVVVGAAMGLAMAFVTVNLQAQQGISGIGFYLFGLGMSTLLFQMLLGTVETVSGFSPIHIPVLSDIPVLGEIFFSHNIMVYGAYALVPIATFVLNKTNIGLKIRSVGENPEAADSVGRPLRDRRRFPVHRPAQCVPAEHDQRPWFHRCGPRVLWGLAARRCVAGRASVQHGEFPSAMASGPRGSDPLGHRRDDALHTDHNRSSTHCTEGARALGVDKAI
jgi:hypothetical protein